MPRRHHSFTIALHWLTLCLLVVGVASVLGREVIDDRALKMTLLNLHRSAGLLIMLVAAVRLLSRWPLAADRVNAQVPQALRLASKLGHSGLYLGLLAIPALGWLLTNARGQAVNLLGVLPLPTLLARDRDLAETLEGWHANLAWALIALAVVHATAALWHHYVRKDQVLRSMLVLRRPSNKS